MNKKSQSAMEFLMNYGWAFLVILATIGALAYIGIYKSDDAVPDVCQFPAGIDCVDKPSLNSVTGMVQLAFRNSLGTSVNVTGVSSDSGNSCGAVSEFEIGSSGMNESRIVSNTEAFIVSIKCSSSVRQGKFSDTFTLSYENPDSGLAHTSTGVVRGRV